MKARRPMPIAPSRRHAFWLVLMLLAASVATAASVAGAVGLHRASKPLVMLFAICLVAGRADLSGVGTRFRWILMLALACSLAGDVFLMFEGLFLPGLVAFLLAHLAYLALFLRGLPWLPSRAAALATSCRSCNTTSARSKRCIWSFGHPARRPAAKYRSHRCTLIPASPPRQ